MTALSTCPRCGRPLPADAVGKLCPACVLEAALNLTPAPAREKEGAQTPFRRARLKHYRLLEKIGEGGMGVVYKARDTRLDRLVAIKILPADKVSDAERRRRFVHEAKAASGLNHPNIVTIHEVAASRGVYFIAMEFVAGRTLDQLVGSHGLPVEQVLLYAIPIAGALARAHEAGIVHRDLKPQNIMVRDDGLVKLLDFGLAKLVEVTEAQHGHVVDPAAPAVGYTQDVAPRGSAGTSGDTLLTEPSRIMGTPGFMAPEQIEGRKVDGRADIFAFGAVLYHALSGRKPFGRSTVDETFQAILHEEPAALENAPNALATTIRRCLAKNPNDRFQTAAELQAELRAVASASSALRVVAPRAGPLTEIPEAMHCYLLGRQALASSDLATAREQLEKATRLDPHFAAAFCALAEVWWYLGFWGILPPRQANAQGIWYALRALELDDQLAETHALIAQYRKDQDYDWAESRRELARALAIAPDSPKVHFWHAAFVGAIDGALDEACAELEAILKADPADVASRVWLTMFLVFRGDGPRAIEQGHKVIAQTPRTAFAYYLMAMCLEWSGSGRHRDAVEAMTKFAELTGRCAHALGGLAWLEGLAGETAKARTLLDELLGRTQAGYVPPTAVVIAYLGLGDIDAAVEWFDRAIEARDQWSVVLKVNPMCDPMRMHPRYPELLRMMKMEA